MTNVIRHLTGKASSATIKSNIKHIAWCALRESVAAKCTLKGKE